MPIEELNAVYADMSNIVAYRVQKRNLTNWIDRRVQAIEDSLFEDRVPNGNVSGLCQYCKYQTRCYNDRNGLTVKPLSIPRTSLG
jgi:CRISPR/Cas system-associated exonuclease Cas4 (RecB family)